MLAGPKGGTNVKLLDFGLAKITEAPAAAALTAEGVIVDTFQYMSPDQLESKEPMRVPISLPSARCSTKW